MCEVSLGNQMWSWDVRDNEILLFHSIGLHPPSVVSLPLIVVELMAVSARDVSTIPDTAQNVIQFPRKELVYA